jgi:hypothetical protein
MFGDKFATALGDLASGRWQCPVESGYGAHIVFLEGRTEGSLPPLGDVHEAVRREWSDDQQREATDRFFQSLLRKYVVITDAPSATATASGSASASASASASVPDSLATRGSRMLLLTTVTAFTVAHSITLSLAALGFVRVPPAPVEAVIALSIVFVAAEIVHGRQGRPGLTEKASWVVALAFGLLHGFGFAGALSQIGLPQRNIPLALLSFNVGVEVGQLLFIAAVLSVIAVARRAARRLPSGSPSGAGASRPMPLAACLRSG